MLLLSLFTLTGTFTNQVFRLFNVTDNEDGQNYQNFVQWLTLSESENEKDMQEKTESRLF